jgi:hypothetical protein
MDRDPAGLAQSAVDPTKRLVHGTAHGCVLRDLATARRRNLEVSDTAPLIQIVKQEPLLA